MTDDVAQLARGFARSLEALRDRFELHYVGRASLPFIEPPSAPQPASDAELQAAASAPTQEDAEAQAQPVAAPRQQEVETTVAPAPVANTPRPARGSAPTKAPTPSAPPATIADPAERALAAKARKSARREQAQQWSAATKLEYLRRQNVGDCQRCPLCRTRNSIVFGVGSAEADLMFVGEAPGADEDRQGEPFVGRGGQLLNRWLETLGLRRQDIYIANVLKCRPPGNRDPRPQEVERCSPFLQAQIRAIEPKVIVALGRHAGMLLSRRDDLTLRAMRSTSRLFYDAGAPKNDPQARIRIPLVVTYHPAYVLRQEGDGAQARPGRASPTEMVMADLNRALSIIGEA